MNTVEHPRIPQGMVELERQHAEIREQIELWRQWWHELSELGQPHLGEMGDRLTRFRDLLAAHFRFEEFRGPMAELIRTATPEQSATIRGFWADHGTFLEELDAQIKELVAGNGHACCWGEARSRFEAFLDRLQDHDRAEHALIEEMTRSP